MNSSVQASDHRDRTYLVLGATGGVGRALASSLAAAGARLVIGGRNRERLGELAEKIGAIAITTDATQFESVEAAVQMAVDRFGRLDGIANCVGSLLLKPAHLTTAEEWEQVVKTNLDSAFFAVKAGARAMMREGGSIVLVSSAAARTGLANHEAIAAAKAGIIGLVQAAAASYGARGIRVNCVAPGLIDSPLTERIFANDKAKAASFGLHALGRAGTTAEVARSMAWLLSPDQGWITGQVIGIDGGLATVRARA